MRMALSDYLAGRPVNLGNSFSAAKTSVIAPIGGSNASGGIGATQVMNPVSGANAQTQSHNNYMNDNQSQRSGSKKKVAIVAATIAVIAIIAVVAAVFAFGGSNEKVTVPDVTGMTSAQAVEALEAEGLQVGTTTSAYDDSVEAGKVIKQDPSARTKVAKDSKVNLTISQGSEQIAVPSVTGKTLEEAKKAIVNAGFIVGDTTTKTDSSVEKGDVISQTPSADSKANKGSKIDIVVSSGAEQVTVPTITNLTVDEARSKAEAAGLTISQYSSDYSDTVAAGYIMSQNPTAGGSVDKGSTISYVLSLGSQQVTVPDVVGYTESGAQSAIANAGLKYAIVEQSSSTVASGLVISQSIAGGSNVSADTTVTLYVSTGSGSSASSSASSSARSAATSN
jgi:serine/threonine-protein kinase